MWLPGVGQTSQVSGAVKCEVVRMSADQSLSEWSTAANSATGIFISNLTLNDSSVYSYGFLPTSKPTGSSNYKRVFEMVAAEPFIGIWGYE